MDARILRWCVAVAIVVMLLLAVPVIAHAAPGGGKGSGPDSTECQHTTMKLFDEKYEPEFNNSLGSYTNMSAYLYQRWDASYQVWCGGFQTRASFEIDDELPLSYLYHW